VENGWRRRAEDHWRSGVLLFWLIAAAVMIFQKWAAIHWFALGDTDDNMRMSQVRALLHGQGWYDLRQYKLDPPGGASIHWTRLVDLPIAGIILAAKPFFGGIIAEKAAVALAPVLALGAALWGLALAVRRLVAPSAYLLACGILMCGWSAMAMWAPLRIDHHGWQLAMLILAVAGSADPEARRGGVTVGLATAVSLTIGLELMPHMALAGVVIVLRWAWDRAEAGRLKTYGAALAGGSALGFLLFASYDNRQFVCDVLSPVYLSAVLASGALLVLLASLGIERRELRFAAALGAGLLLAGAFALVWPQCLGRPERLSPELQRLWFDNVREAKPIYQHGYRIALPTVALPVIGLVGSLLALWRARGTALFPAWLAPASLALFSSGLLLWQTRAGPGAQLLAVPGATALGWMLMPRLALDRLLPLRLLGAAAAFVAVSGLFMPFALQAVPDAPRTVIRQKIDLANRRCPTLPALRPIALLPAATILTFVDFGPRLITVTHHRAIAGPYHRNQRAILDVQHAFRARSPEVAHEVMRRHGATLLLLCPGMSESTLYVSQDKDGFYVQLQKGQVPRWLERVELPKSSPFKLWRLVG
jgi:hypothetical protein